MSDQSAVLGNEVDEREPLARGLAAHRERWRPPGHGVFVRTYNLLRWSMPILFIWLTFAVIGAWVGSQQNLPMTSISAYYYTNAQTVFVGVIISLGVLLVVIQGRTPWEDALMNTAGALAPFVALLPTPVKASELCTAAYCTDKFLKDVIPDNRPLIDFNMWSVAPVWVLLCVYLWRRSALIAAAGDTYEKASSRFSAVATTVLGLLALALWRGGGDTATQNIHYDWAHLFSAGLMVALLIVSMIPFARWWGPSSRGWLERMPRGFDNGFWWVFWITIVLVVACIVWSIVSTLVDDHWRHRVLVIEIAALAPFVVYWTMQGLALRRLDQAEVAATESGTDDIGGE